MTGRRLLVATRSAHKLRELRELLDLHGTDLISLEDLGIADDPVEDGATFESNAALKARFSARISGLPTLADDSGLEVDALAGGPGVRTPGEGSDGVPGRSLDGGGSRSRFGLALAATPRPIARDGGGVEGRASGRTSGPPVSASILRTSAPTSMGRMKNALPSFESASSAFFTAPVPRPK